MAETAGMNTGTGTPAPQEIRRQELAALLERAQAGDRVALEEIVARLMPLVWNVARAEPRPRDRLGRGADRVADAVAAHRRHPHVPGARLLAGHRHPPRGTPGACRPAPV